MRQKLTHAFALALREHDGDGLSNEREINEYGTDPNRVVRRTAVSSSVASTSRTGVR